ncbi:unnamed protein product [Gongylonema pulchrum]|uniref:Transposase n=1 Tax=Gongylonema pulchrum TaxID=637853 RepID=A0A183DWS4_9BILA|nr:unnamed protein product [Gongylonema pulchrum]
MMGWDNRHDHVHLTYEIGRVPFVHNELLYSSRGLTTPLDAGKLVSGLQYLYSAPIESRLEHVPTTAR